MFTLAPTPVGCLLHLLRWKTLQTQIFGFACESFLLFKFVIIRFNSHFRENPVQTVTRAHINLKLSRCLCFRLPDKDKCFNLKPLLVGWHLTLSLCLGFPTCVQGTLTISPSHKVDTAIIGLFASANAHISLKKNLTAAGYFQRNEAKACYKITVLREYVMYSFAYLWYHHFTLFARPLNLLASLLAPVLT